MVSRPLHCIFKIDLKSDHAYCLPCYQRVSDHHFWPWLLSQPPNWHLWFPLSILHPGTRMDNTSYHSLTQNLQVTSHHIGKQKQKPKSFHVWVSPWISHWCLPTTHPLSPFSPLRSHCSPLNMPSMLLTQGLCISCPFCLGNIFCTFLFYLIWVSALQKGRPNYPFKNELSYPSLFKPLSHFTYLHGTYNPMAFYGYWSACLLLSPCGGI